MLAVEFHSAINNGIIQIPEQFVNQVGQKVRVILLSEINETTDKKPNFSASSINTKGYKFSREVANER